jgi:hypothetical protein
MHTVVRVGAVAVVAVAVVSQGGVGTWDMGMACTGYGAVVEGAVDVVGEGGSNTVAKRKWKKKRKRWRKRLTQWHCA